MPPRNFCPPSLIHAMNATELHSCDVERRCDGVVLVRVHSSCRYGRPLPDAVFSFRRGDPQFEYWEKQCFNRVSARQLG